MKSKRILCVLLALLMLSALSACGEEESYHVKSTLTLVEQDYALAFRNDDPLMNYVVAAIEELNAEGKVDELSRKWFGRDAVSFGKKEGALSLLEPPKEHTLLMGADSNSFPMVYMQDGNYWGFDIELAMLVCQKLGWKLEIQHIEKEEVYDQLASGNIDVAWGGVALNPDEVAAGKYTQYGPYIHNDIIIIARDGSRITSASRLKGKNLAMPVTQEAMDALETEPSLKEALGRVTRVPGGTIDCFAALYNGDCDAVLTDSTAMLYYNSH